MDIQFKSIKDRKRLNLVTNVVSRGEHVPDIERHHWVLKERARCYCATLLKVDINTLPRIMVNHLMTTVNFYVNAFVWRRGVSQILPPITIVEGLVVNFNKYFHVIFGEYMHTYEGTDNTMKVRTVAALALGPSGNLQGGVRCYSLRTGKVLHRFMKDITLMKMPHDVLGQLKYITRKEKSVKGLIFGDRYDNIIPDDVITGVLVPEETLADKDDNYVNAPYKLIDDGPAIEADETDGNEIEELDNYKVKQEE